MFGSRRPLAAVEIEELVLAHLRLERPLRVVAPVGQEPVEADRVDRPRRTGCARRPPSPSRPRRPKSRRPLAPRAASGGSPSQGPPGPRPRPPRRSPWIPVRAARHRRLPWRGLPPEPSRLAQAAELHQAGAPRGRARRGQRRPPLSGRREDATRCHDATSREQPAALEALLDFYVEAGVDLALDEAPHDRFAEPRRLPGPRRRRRRKESCPLPPRRRPGLSRRRPPGAPEDAAVLPASRRACAVTRRNSKRSSPASRAAP